LPAQRDAIGEAELVRRPAGLAQVVLVDVDRQRVGAAARELEGVEARVAADVERAGAA